MTSKIQKPEFCPEALADCWCGRMLFDNTQDNATQISSEPALGLLPCSPERDLLGNRKIILSIQDANERTVRKKAYPQSEQIKSADIRAGVAPVTIRGKL